MLDLMAGIAALDQSLRMLVEARLSKGFQWTQFAVLDHLARLGEGQTPVALARSFAVAKTSMTHTLIVLERHGLIRIEPNPRDGRSKLVWLTPKGRNLRALGVAALTADLRALMAVEGLEALRHVAEALRQQAQALLPA